MAYGDSKPFITSKGYVRLYRPAHPLANKWGHVMEHRMVAWDHGILTDPKLHVHHLNGDPGDNRPENLRQVTAKSHAIHHPRRRRWATKEDKAAYEKDRGRRRHIEGHPRRICEVCGKEFGWSELSDGRGCSQRCRAAIRRADGRLPKYKRICEVCGKEFRTRMGDGRACSPRCRAQLSA